MIKSLRVIAYALVAVAALHGFAFAQSSPNLVFGQVPTAAQWNSYFSAKQDVLSSPPLSTSGGIMIGKLVTEASSAANAGLNLPQGTAPTSPVNGDFWITSSGVFARVNGATVGPFTAGSAGNPCTTTASSIQFDAAGSFGCVANVTSDGTHMTVSSGGLIISEAPGAQVVCLGLTSGNAVVPSTTGACGPGGTSGQIQFNSAGSSLGGFTASGAVTINTSTGVVSLNAGVAATNVGTLGGVLSGTLPNPAFAANKVRQITPVTTFFVTATGSDSNDCEAATVTGGHGPCLTIQHAYNVLWSFDLNGNTPTLNVGAGTFASFEADGIPVIGNAAPNGITVPVVGAGSGSTTIQTGISIRVAHVSFTGVTVECTAATPAISIDASGTVVLTSDIVFNGNSASADCWSVNQFASVIQAGNVTLSGTIGTYFSGFSSALYEQNGGILTVSGTVGTLANLDMLSNFHTFGGTVVVSGTTNDNAYVLTNNSVFEDNIGDIDSVWVGGGGEVGQVASGSRTSGAAAPSVTSSTGIGTGTAAADANSTTYLVPITLSPSGSPSSTGTVVVKINDFLNLQGASPSGASYMAALQTGSASWGALATAHITAVSSTSAGRSYTISWSNNGSNLTAGQTYLINLIGQN